ncbi:APC family permease [Salinibacterium sp. ZJ450]|uniref:APC family permease n=1 Tax=Salinibacterium sp. ZJ450 TaxID=2708338 RepID=UPI0014242A82|nr:APC family permease [Salinibacterium sp. ZJ450]
MSKRTEMLEPVDRSRRGGTKLRGHLGVLSLVFIVMAGMTPLTGVAGYMPLVIAYGNGLGAPFMLLLTGLVILIFSVGYVGIIRRVARPGAFYAYITAGLGKRVGLGGAFVTVTTYLFAMMGLYVFGGMSASTLVSELGGPAIAWWIFAAVLLAASAITVYLNITISLRFVAVIVVIEFLIVLIFDFVVAFQGGPEGITTVPFTVEALTSGSLALGFLFSVTMFMGFEGAALYYEEARDPQRSISRATYIIAGVLAVFLGFTCWMMIVSIGESDALAVISADPAGSFIAALAVHLGSTFASFASVLVLTAAFACAVSIANMLSRYVYSLSVDRVAPAYFGVASARHGSPARASVLVNSVYVVGLAAAVVANIDPNIVLALSAGFGTFGLLIIFSLASVAIFVYFIRNREPRRGRQVAILASAAVSAVFFGIMVLYVANNLDVIVGDMPAVIIGLQVILYAAFVGGIVFASYLAVKRPDVFQHIGRMGFVTADGSDVSPDESLEDKPKEDVQL